MTAACQASLSSIISWCLLRLMSTGLVMLSNHFILCYPLLLPPIFPSIRVYSNEAALCIRWPKYWSFRLASCIFCSVHVSHSVMSNSLLPHGLQHTRPPCPPPTPGACSNSCPSSWCCYPTISSFVVPFSFCLQSFPASRSFPMSQFFESGAKDLEVQLQHQSFQWIFRTDFI